MKSVRKPDFAIMAFMLIGMIAIMSASCGSPSDTSDVYKTGFLVDVRTPEEFAAGAVEGAVNIPLDEIETRLDEFKGKKHIVVMCRSGNRSKQAKEILEKNGFTNVTDGGPWTLVAEKIKK